MVRRIAIATLAVLALSAPSLAIADQGDAPERLQGAVAAALESGDAASLARLFPDDRKVSVFFDRIADLKGYVGPGPLVEAIRRHLQTRSEVRFEGARAWRSEEDGGPIRVKGTLSSRDSAGRRERIDLKFVFTRIEGGWRATEVRETG